MAQAGDDDSGRRTTGAIPAIESTAFAPELISHYWVNFYFYQESTS